MLAGEGAFSQDHEEVKFTIYHLSDSSSSAGTLSTHILLSSDTDNSSGSIEDPIDPQVEATGNPTHFLRDDIGNRRSSLSIITEESDNSHNSSAA